MTTCASTTPIMAANWQHVDISEYYKHSWNHEHMRLNDTDYGGKLTPRASIPLQLDFLPCTEVPLMGLPSEVTHQQKPVAEWHCTSAYVPSVLQSGINTPNVGFLASFTASSLSFIQLLACRPEAESEVNAYLFAVSDTTACLPPRSWKWRKCLLIRSESILTFIQLLACRPEAESEENACLYEVSQFLLFFLHNSNFPQYLINTSDISLSVKFPKNVFQNIGWIILSNILLMYFVEDFIW